MVAGIVLFAVSCSKQDNHEQAGGQGMATPGSSVPSPVSTVIITSSGLKIEVLKEGSGPEVKPGQYVSVHYTGWLDNGIKFDSSVDRGEPIQFRLSTGRVIRGWDMGLVGMKVGEKRKLTIPPDLAYGSKGYPPMIPPNSTLIFDVELMNISQ
jgi:FKBP-type peptidyl-prolyl cis-trans isomerase